MKNIIALLAGLALASAAFAEIDPTRPMLTGRGNVSVTPAQFFVTNQTAAKADEGIRLDKFIVTGSLLAVNPKRVMVTGRGNVNVTPAQFFVTNQTAAKADEGIRLDKFIVTGSLLKH